MFDFLLPPYTGANIIARIPATIETNELIVVGAHYDTVYDSPGANDNGSGITIVLAAAQAILKLPARRFHFDFVLFDQEEDDGIGSSHYAKKLLREGVRVHSMHNVDMAGWDSDGNRAMDIEIPTAELAVLYERYAEELNIPLQRVRYQSSDHLAFRRLGIDSVCLSESFSSGDYTPHRHRNSDTYQTVDFDYLTRSGKLLSRVLMHLATAP
ncbi:MAG: M28 family metallopeptidase [Gammaproteobacteria bacterium]